MGAAGCQPQAGQRPLVQEAHRAERADKAPGQTAALWAQEAVPLECVQVVLSLAPTRRCRGACGVSTRPGTRSIAAPADALVLKSERVKGEPAFAQKTKSNVATAASTRIRTQPTAADVASRAAPLKCVQVASAFQTAATANRPVAVLA